MKVSLNCILKILKRNGVNRRSIERKKILKSDEPKIIEMYQSGMSAPEIAEKFNVTHVLILRYLEKNKIERRNSSECHRIYEINEDFLTQLIFKKKHIFLNFYMQMDVIQKTANILELIFQHQIEIFWKNFLN